MEHHHRDVLQIGESICDAAELRRRIERRHFIWNPVHVLQLITYYIIFACRQAGQSSGIHKTTTTEDEEDARKRLEQTEATWRRVDG